MTRYGRRTYRPSWLLILAGFLLSPPVQGQILHFQSEPTAGVDRVLDDVGFGDSASGEGDALRNILASAAVPGLGQVMGKVHARAGWALIGLDALMIGAALHQRGEGRAARREYRDLAWRTARGAPTPRIEGDFEYFERMGQWVSSGRFDQDPDADGLQPETRTETFNGDAWRLAQALFLQGEAGVPGTPEWEAALSFYRERAYPDALLWDWTGLGQDRTRYNETIARSDDFMRRAGWAVATSVGLRLVAVLDLYIADRTRGRVGAGAGISSGGMVEGWLRLAVPR